MLERVWARRRCVKSRKDGNAPRMRATDLLRAAFVAAAATLGALGHISYVNVAVSAAAVVASRFLELRGPYDYAFIVAMALRGGATPSASTAP